MHKLPKTAKHSTRQLYSCNMTVLYYMKTKPQQEVIYEFYLDKAY